MEDKDIIKLLKDDSESGMRALIEKYQKMLFAFIKKKFPDFRKEDSEEIVQETFLIFWMCFKNGKYTEMGKLSSYLVRICHLLCLGFLKGGGESLLLFDPSEMTLDLLSDEEDSANLERRRFMEMSFEKLDECVKSNTHQSIELFKEHYEKNIPIVKLAEREDMPPNRLRQHFSVIRDQIRRCFGL